MRVRIATLLAASFLAVPLLVRAAAVSTAEHAADETACSAATVAGLAVALLYAVGSTSALHRPRAVALMFLAASSSSPTFQANRSPPKLSDRSWVICEPLMTMSLGLPDAASAVDAVVEATGIGRALTPLPAESIVVAAPAQRHHAGRSGRSPSQRARPRRLSLEEREALRASAPNHTLRELAAEFGVSHETIRAVVRSPAPSRTIAARTGGAAGRAARSVPPAGTRPPTG